MPARVETRFTSQPLWRRSVTIFTGVMAVVFGLGTVAEVIFSNPATAAENGTAVTDFRSAVLRGGIAVMLVILAVLNHYEQEPSLLLTVAGLMILLMTGIDLLRQESVSALADTVLAVGMLFLAWFLKED